MSRHRVSESQTETQTEIQLQGGCGLFFEYIFIYTHTYIHTFIYVFLCCFRYLQMEHVRPLRWCPVFAAGLAAYDRWGITPNARFGFNATQS